MLDSGGVVPNSANTLHISYTLVVTFDICGMSLIILRCVDISMQERTKVMSSKRCRRACD